MPGLRIFKNLAQAERAGYKLYAQTARGYLVRTRTEHGWALAIVEQRSR